MGFPGFRATCSFAPAAGSAHHRNGPDVALGGFVPPLLLRFRPHLRDAARFAMKRHVHVVATCHELGNTVAVVGPEVRRIDQKVPVRDVPQFLAAIARLLSRHLGLSGTALQSAPFKNGRASRFPVFHDS